MDKLSTEQVAKKLGISKSALSRYILAGKVSAPPETMAGASVCDCGVKAISRVCGRHCQDRQWTEDAVPEKAVRQSEKEDTGKSAGATQNQKEIAQTSSRQRSVA